VFAEDAQGGELVGSDFEMKDSSAQSLIHTIPRAAQQWREATAFGRVDRDAFGGRS
jgi:hypothetical protein